MEIQNTPQLCGTLWRQNQIMIRIAGSCYTRGMGRMWTRSSNGNPLKLASVAPDTSRGKGEKKWQLPFVTAQAIRAYILSYFLVFHNSGTEK